MNTNSGGITTPLRPLVPLPPPREEEMIRSRWEEHTDESEKQILSLLRKFCDSLRPVDLGMPRDRCKLCLVVGHAFAQLRHKSAEEFFDALYQRILTLGFRR